jgi:hypothetical protein
MMKNIMIVMMALAGTILPVHADEPYIDYMEGEVNIRNNKGTIYGAGAGDLLETGYSVLTGEDGYAEVYSDGDLIRINEGTVFQLMETEQGGKETDVFSCVMGSVYLKMKSLSDDETGPLITTQSAACGVRGTAFSVFSGLDGSSLIAVEEGKVEVSSKGEAVELTAEEGVEVKPGETPGEKFRVLRGQLDFRKWNGEREDEFLHDPAPAVERVCSQMESLIAQLTAELEAYTANFERLTEKREKLESFGEDEKDALRKFRTEILFPLEIETSYLYMNVRYYALSALSLRRYVLGRMYVMMKSMYMTKRDNEAYTNFIRCYGDILASYEKHVVPHLVPADI